MMSRRGFTIVELVVVMTIMAILLTLGVVSFNTTQAKARDTERSTDIDAIARGLESSYSRPVCASASFIMQGAYPSVSEFQYAQGATYSGTITPSSPCMTLDQLIPGTNKANFYPPSTKKTTLMTAFIPMCTSTCNAEDSARISSTVTKDVYVYEPINASNQVCITDSTGCVRFNLYYLNDAGALQKKESRHS